MKLSKPQLEGFRGQKWLQDVAKAVNRRPRILAHYTNGGDGENGAGTDIFLYSWDAPASLFPSRGWCLDFSFAGEFAANANNKRIAVYFGSPTHGYPIIFDTGTLPLSGGGWSLKISVFNPIDVTIETESVWVATSTALPTDVQITQVSFIAPDENMLLYILIDQGATDDITLWQDRVTLIPVAESYF